MVIFAPMQKLPIGIQDFAKLRKGGFVYVDKTKNIYELTAQGGYYFLSRPRRFGKSLLVSTMKELFSGNKELFKGLWIEDKWNWEETHPVLHIPFASLGYKSLGLETALHRYLDKVIKNRGFGIQEESLSQKFEELLIALSQENEVVLLIDEYDKPIIDYLGGEIEQAKENQQVLKKFYSVIKDSDRYLRMVFITGVSKFSKVSIFSDLNNLEDLTVGDYLTADMMGYTQEELERYFAEYIPPTAEMLQMSREKLLEEIRAWYNGYSWDGKCFVYNPFSILNFFKKRAFFNFWFQTATPTFLIELIKKKPYYDFDGMEVGLAAFESFDLEHISTISLLFQTGYLTIQSINEYQIAVLGYPNREVKQSMLSYLMTVFADIDAAEVPPIAIHLRQALVEEDIKRLVSVLNSLLKRLPHQLKGKTEAFYHAVVHIIFHLLGIFLRSEVNTAEGRADAIVETDRAVYCIEFKLDKTAREALEQIKEKGYLDGYRQLDKKLIAVGINFSAKAGAIDDWAIEQY